MPVYCITGVNRGLGLEFVRQLAADETNTIIALTRSLSSDLTDLHAAAAAAEPAKGSGSAHIFECDVGDAGSITRFVADVSSSAKKLRLRKIDVLVNNAGINRKSSQSSLNLDPSLLEEMMRVNVVGPMLLTRELLAADMLAGDVRVVNITSGLGSVTDTLTGPRYCCGYSVSKAALNMLTAHMADDIRSKGGLEKAVAIVMDPGWVKTRLGGSNAVLTPEESVSAMLRVIGSLGEGDNASFFGYGGEKKPW